MLICTNSIWHWSNTTIKMKETPLVPFESMACFLYLLRPFEQILGGVSLQNHSINTSSTFELVNEVPQEQLSCCEILFVRKCQIMCRPVLSPFLPRCLCCHVLWTLAHMEVSHLTHPPSQMTPTPQTDANAQHFYPGVYSSQISTESCFLFVVLTYFSPEVIFGPSWILKTNPKWLQEFCKFSKNSPRRQTKHQKLSSFWPILLKTELHSLQNPLNRCHWLVWTSTAPCSNASECVCIKAQTMFCWQFDFLQSKLLTQLLCLHEWWNVF